jgi:SAM-dependent methyltransferase
MDRSYPADLYLAVHRGTPGDIWFYRRVCSGADSVLELGCGAGRIATAIAADGLHVVGVENNPELLDRAPPSGAELQLGDMRTVSVGETFDRVLIPYNGVYCLLEEEDAVQCFEHVRAHLREGGLMVFDAYAADEFHQAAGEQPEWDEPELVMSIQLQGRSWDVYEHSWLDREWQRIDAVYDHVPREGGDTVRGVIAQRYLLSTQVQGLLERAGLELVALLGDFDEEAFGEDSDRLIAVAAHPGTVVA